MSEERFDIEVSDKIERTIADKLREIAEQARSGHSAVLRLKEALADINSTPVSRLAEATSKLTSALNNELKTQRQLTTDTNAATAATLKAELGKVRLEQASARAAVAEQKLSAETAKTQATIAVAYLRTEKALSEAVGAQIRSENATASLNTELARTEFMQTKVAVATSNAALADAKAATEKQKLATEAAKTAEALSKAERAANALSAAQAREAELFLKQMEDQRRVQDALANAQVSPVQSRINSVTGVDNGAVKSARESAMAFQAAEEAARQNALAVADLEGRMNRLRASVDPLGVAYDRLNAELLEAQSLAARGAISLSQLAQAETVLNARIRDNIAAQQQMNAVNTASQAAMAKTSYGALNLSRQFADVGVTAAMGMNPLLILIQQGPQIADALGEMKREGVGVSAAFKNMGGMLGGLIGFLLPVAAIVAPIALAFGALHEELSKGYPKDITEGLNLTEEQLERVKSKTVTFGDTFMATLQVVGKHIMEGPIGAGLAWLGNAFMETMKWIGKIALEAVIQLTSFFTAAYVTIRDHWKKFPAALGAIFVSAVNLAIAAVEELLNASIRAINYISEIAGISLFEELDLGRLEQGNNEVAASYTKVYEETEKATRAFFDQMGVEIQATAITNARARALKEAGKANKAGGGFDGSKELQDINRELDNELSRLGMLKEAREVQNRLDQITQKYAEKGKTLTEGEISALRTKLELIQKMTRVQTEMDRIYEDISGPQQKYNDALLAATMLQAQGAITSVQHTAAVNAATEAYRVSKDPLASYNDEMQRQIDLFGLYGPQLEKAQYLQGIEQEMRTRGLSLYEQSTGAMTAEGEALSARFDILQRGLEVQRELNSVYEDVTAGQMYMQNITYMYDEINRMRQNDVLTHEQAERAKALVANRYNEMRLQSTRSFFSTLAGLSSSGNKKLAAIGKAAAIAQATIDGFLAIQKALASSPPPMNYINAAAIGVATAANVASIVSTNVGGFKDGGSFQVGGRDGVDTNMISMAVTKGERVTVETAAQQRAAMEAGTSGGANVSVPVKVVNVTDPSEILAAMDSSQGEEVILNVLGRNPNAVAAIAGTRN